MGIGTIIGLSFLGLIVVVLIVGYFLPRKVHVARSVSINASKEEIFHQLNSLKNFVEWSPWTEKDPNMVQTYTGPEFGQGATYAWEGHPKKVGNGSMTITKSEENKRVETKLDFGRRGLADANWIIEDLDGKSKVIWTLDTDMGANPVGRYFGLFMDRMIGPDYEHGLNKLKAKVENKKI